MKIVRSVFPASAIILFLSFLASCNDDFLDKNNRNGYTLSDTIFVTNSNPDVDINIELPERVSSNFTVYMLSKWISFGSMHGFVESGSLSLRFRVNKDYFSPGYQTNFGTIVIDVEELGYVQVTVGYANYGNPEIACSITSLDFETPASKSFSLNNTASGILFWQMKGIPDRLIISETSGSIYAGGSVSLSASLDPGQIKAGEDLSAEIVISGNSVTGDLKIPVHVSAMATTLSEFRKINGNVTDAEFHPESGRMAICTTSPNNLILINTFSAKSAIIPLSGTPVCINISEDGQNAVVGFSEQAVAYVDLVNQTIIREYPVDCVPFDIVIGGNGWCYFTPSTGQWVYFRSMNLNNGNIVVGTNLSTVYEKTIIKKIPGKPVLIGTRTILSPSGLLIFNINKGSASDSITYFHISIDRILISADGKKLYNSFNSVYNIPDYDGLYHFDQPEAIGKIPTSVGNNFLALTECPVKKLLFTSSVNNDYIYGDNYPIEEFSTTNYTRLAMFNPSAIIVPGISAICETNAKYLFADKEGIILYAIKNLKQGYNMNYWSIETFKIK